MIAQAAAATLVAIIYFIFKGIFNKVKHATSKDKHIVVPKTFENQLNINDKHGFLDRIDYWIENEDYKEAMHLCNIYHNYNDNDDDINRRLKYISKFN